MMPATYFEVQFEAAEPWTRMPEEFAIITAYATTGQVWPDDVNYEADRRLEAELRQMSAWVQRLTGYSPSTAHREPGWAVEIGFDAACDIGLRYKQDAIYMVNGRDLGVSYCDERRGLARVGEFQPRLSSRRSGNR